MTSDSPQIQKIKQRYRASFPEKLELVRHFRTCIEERGDQQVAFEGLHKLAGSSGMYGYDDIAALCRSAMQDIENGNLTRAVNQLDQLIELLQA